MRKFIVAIIILVILEIALSLYLTFWREGFWNAVQQKNLGCFTHELIVFAVVALCICFVSTYSGYFTARIAIKWRKHLNSKAIQLPEDAVSNVNQRIQEDCRDYPFYVLLVGVGFAKAVMYVSVFATSLILEFNIKYLIFILLYAMISTFIARKIAKPLISLNYKAQCAEATYRNDLSFHNFQDCIAIMLGVAKKTKHLTSFQSFYGQLAVMLPIIIVAHDYFLGGMTIGGLMMATSTMAVVSENMSYGINSFSSINKLISCRVRLKEIGII
jgi:putative ATP-binding cassette transporter